MGVPGVAAYVIVASIVAPTLVDAGAAPMAAQTAGSLLSAAPMSARTEGSLLSAAGISALMFYFTGTAPAFLIRSEAAEEIA